METSPFHWNLPKCQRPNWAFRIIFPHVSFVPIKTMESNECGNTSISVCLLFAILFKCLEYYVFVFQLHVYTMCDYARTQFIQVTTYIHGENSGAASIITYLRTKNSQLHKEYEWNRKKLENCFNFCMIYFFIWLWFSFDMRMDFCSSV